MSMKDIKTRTIRVPSMGKCYEINLEQFNASIVKATLVFKMEGYVWVNMNGQFHNQDSHSKLVVKTAHCTLF